MIAELHAATWRRLIALRGRLPHALLLQGPAGIGKLDLALRFAQALLCEAADPRSAPCGGCSACRWFLAGNHPDVRRVEPEAFARPPGYAEGEEAARTKAAKPSTEIKVEQIRALADFVNLGSHRGGRRIVVVHPAEDMNAAAANALLKSLEEPPAGAIFVMVSHRPWRLLPTVRSRCVPLPVPLPEVRVARAWLAEQGVSEPERWLAYAGGAPRLALEYAVGEKGKTLDAFIRAVEQGELWVVAGVEDREALELFAEAIQKLALDRAFAALAGKAKYYGAAARPRGEAGEGRKWLEFAREMGRYRMLSRHPLNPRLLATEMVSRMPAGAG